MALLVCQLQVNLILSELIGNNMADYPDYLQDDEDSPESRSAKAQYSALRSMLDSGPMPQMGSPEYASGKVEESAIQPDDLAQAATAVGTGGLSLAAKAGASKIGLPLLMGTLAKKGEQGVAKALEQKAALDMSEAARMARAKEMGFDTSKTYYRGLAGEPYVSNQPQYFTDNPRFASGYALGSAHISKEGQDKVEDLLSKSKELTNLYSSIEKRYTGTDLEKPAINFLSKEELSKIKEIAGEDFSNSSIGDVDLYLANEPGYLLNKADKFYGEEGKQANVIPAHLKIKNPLIYDFRDKYFSNEKMKQLIEEAKKSGNDSVLFKNVTDFTPNDGLRYTGDQIVVLKPQNIRSKFAEFDPAKADSSDLAAGLAGAGISLPALKALLEKNKTSKDEL